MTRQPPIAYRAAWVFPVAGPPVRDGMIEIDAAGRVEALRDGPGAGAIDLGPVAIVPALVNAHVHLEFSDLARPIGPASPFPQWVRNVVAHRRGRTESVERILRRGIGETTRSGTAAVGEIATSDVVEPYRRASADVVLFRELIGPLQERWPDLLALAERHLSLGEPDGGRGSVDVRPHLDPPPEREGKTRGAERVRPGLSPHAPYTVPQELFERAVALAARHAAPIAVHLAETAAERDLFASGTGELVGMMQSLGLWRPELNPAGRRPLDWIRALAAAPHGLVVHGNFLDDEELDLIAAGENLSLVYCPRTHAYFGHPPHPFRRLIERGGRVALGTDGRSSNPDLDLWREATFVRSRHPDLSAETLLGLITRRGAEALGVADRHGVLAPGRAANFLAVSLAGAGGSEPPDLFGDRNDVIAVYRDGIDVRHSPAT